MGAWVRARVGTRADGWLGTLVDSWVGVLAGAPAGLICVVGGCMCECVCLCVPVPFTFQIMNPAPPPLPPTAEERKMRSTGGVRRVLFRQGEARGEWVLGEPVGVVWTQGP